MGRYTVLDDPVVDQFIGSHLEQIVGAITARSSPQSIVLYGSVARGEASVIRERDRVRMLSDYEVKVVGESPRLRRVCAALSHEMTARLGVDVGIGWMRPDRLRTGRSSNLPFGPAVPSIFLYEFRSAGIVLYGDDILRSSPQIDPRSIPLSSGFLLLLNRMAESLQYLPCSSIAPKRSNLDAIVWISKTLLACAEALLLSAGQYHFSYQERARRFPAVLRENLAPVLDSAPKMVDLIGRATEFKLRPDIALYADDVGETWAEAAIVTDAVFRYLAQTLGVGAFRSYDDFPSQYLRRSRSSPGAGCPANHIVWLLGRKLFEGALHVEHRRWPPPVFFSKYSPSSVVYALVPVLFWSCFGGDRLAMINAIREWLRLLEKLEPQQADTCLEWNYLAQRLLWNWKAFCY